MPIQFRCTRCGRLLQTGDDTAGQQAQCPACGNVTAIPGASAGVPSADTGALSAASAEVAALPPPPVPGEPAVAPAFAAADLQTYAARRVAGPAIALIVLGIFTIVMQVFAILMNILQIGIAGAAARNGDALPFLFGGPVQIVASAIAIVGAIVITLGGLRMKNLENYGLAMTASILTIIPCFGPCCLLGMPIGIWGLVVLSDNTVRIAFRN